MGIQDENSCPDWSAFDGRRCRVTDGCSGCAAESGWLKVVVIEIEIDGILGRSLLAPQFAG
jgi:hypothetical protein